MNENKEYISLDLSVIEALSKAETHDQQVDLLFPLAVALMWERGELSTNGLNKQQHKRFSELHATLENKIGAIDFENIQGSDLFEKASQEGFLEELQEMQNIWLETERARVEVQKYLESKNEGEANEGK